MKLIALVFLPFWAVPAFGGTLVYEATFTTILKNASLYSVQPSPYLYGIDLRDHTLEDLGWEDRLGGMEIGESRQGSLRVYSRDLAAPEGSVYPEGPSYRVDCMFAGGNLDFCPDVEPDQDTITATIDVQTRSIHYHDYDWFYADVTRDLVLGPAGGRFWYEDDGYYDFIIDDVRFSAGDSAFTFDLTDVKVTVPAVVPLPLSGLLLGSALAAMMLRKRRTKP